MPVLRCRRGGAGLGLVIAQRLWSKRMGGDTRHGRPDRGPRSGSMSASASNPSGGSGEPVNPPSGRQADALALHRGHCGGERGAPWSAGDPAVEVVCSRHSPRCRRPATISCRPVFPVPMRDLEPAKDNPAKEPAPWPTTYCAGAPLPCAEINAETHLKRDAALPPACSNRQTATRLIPALYRLLPGR